MGRKKNRIKEDLVKAFLRNRIASLAHLAERKKVSESLIQLDMKRSRDLFIRKTTWPTIPEGQLILIADAVVEMIEDKWRAVYMVLVRGVKNTEAVILPLLILSGGENVSGLAQSFRFNRFKSKNSD